MLIPSLGPSPFAMSLGHVARHLAVAAPATAAR